MIKTMIKTTKQTIFDYSIERRCLACGCMITKNRNMSRIYPDKCYHIICMRKMEESHRMKK